MQRYLRDCLRRGLAARTVESYGERLQVLERAVGRPLAEASRDELQRALDGRGGPASVAAHRSTAVQFWAWLIDEGEAQVNVAERCKAPRVRPGMPRPIDHGDLWRAISGATDTRLRAALHLGALAGLRVAEMAALRWPDVDLRRHLLEVVAGKGGRARVVPMHGALEAVLLELGPHQLRHTAASDFWSATRDIRATAKLLGHSSVRTTEVYARFDLDVAVTMAVRAIAAC